MSKLIEPPTHCIVEHITQVKQGEYGLYQSILFKDSSGNKIWKSFDPGSPELEALTVGTRVQLVQTGTTRSGKPSHNIILDAPAPSPAPVAPAPVGTLSDDVKRAIAAYVADQANLYAFCHSEASRALTSQTTDPETLRCAASSLFISASRKFNLDR